MRHNVICKASNLEQWANTIPARSILPMLVRQLVLATNSTCEHIYFPAGEQVQRPGYDGTVKCVEPSAYVPKGFSVWEMGVNSGFKSKAGTDFDKRNNELTEKTDNAFIFVTPRHWEKKGDWVKEKEKISKFSKIIVYDSADLEGWLETAPAVDLWLANEIGIKPPGATDICTYWNSLQACTNPSLSPDVFLCSRIGKGDLKGPVDDLKEWLLGPPSDITFSPFSPNEPLDFFVAWIASLPDTEAVHYQSRSIIIETKETWDFYSAKQVNEQGLILVAHPKLELEQQQIANATVNGHHVYITLKGLVDTGRGKSLPRINRYELTKVLKNLDGMTNEKAERYAKNCAGSTELLKRQLGAQSYQAKPSWASNETLLKLVPFILAGSWDESNKNDKAIIELLSQNEYSDCISFIRTLEEDEPPFLRSGKVWYQPSRIGIWEYSVSLLENDHLKVFEEVCSVVLGEIDPAIHLDPDERWLAQVKGAKLPFSSRLRTGIVKTLALMGSWIEANGVTNDHLLQVANSAKRIVKTLLDGRDSDLWASLASHLPLLSEAAPDEVLIALEDDLHNPEPICYSFFTDSKETSSPFPATLHTHLLWALENMAWNPRYLTRAALILAQLTENDKGGRLANRPASSLHGLFRGWLPQTSASLEKRLEALEVVSDRFIVASRKLLVSLLPSFNGSIASPAHHPSFRPWHLNSQPVLVNELLLFHKELYKILLKRVPTEPELILNLITPLARGGEEDIKCLEECLNSLAQMDIPECMRNRIWEGMTKYIRKHRSFKTAKWALPEERLEIVERLCDLFSSDDPLLKNKHFFESRAIHYIFDDTEEDETDWSQRHKQLEEIQLKFLMTLKNDPESLLRLLLMVDDARNIGFLMGKGELVLPSLILPSWLEANEDKQREAASTFVSGLYVNSGYAWLEQIDLSVWSTESLADIFLALPFKRGTWGLLFRMSLEVNKLYWKKTGGYLYRDNDDFEFGLNLLMENGRSDAVIKNLDLSSKNDSQYIELAMTALDQLGQDFVNMQGAHNGIGTISFDIQQLFGFLQNSDEVDKLRLAALEFQYLGLLDGYGGSPKTLSLMMAEDPMFFLEVMDTAYGLQKKSEGHEDDPITEQELSQAHQAGRLIYDWNGIPGRNDDGDVDAGKLNEWIEIVRKKAQEWDALDLFDSRIGQVLSFAPSDSDGFWPCTPVCELLEHISSPELEDGIKVGLFNQRGIVTRDIYEGGAQERELAKNYKAQAEKIETRFPRAAKILYQMEQIYTKEACELDQDIRIQ